MVTPEKRPGELRGIRNHMIRSLCSFSGYCCTLQKNAIGIDDAASDLGASDVQREEDTVRRQPHEIL